MPPPSAPYHFEARAWRTGVVRVAGVDEAGRGPLAGPVVAVAVGVGVVDHVTIDRVNILQATRAAMLEALHQLKVAPDLVITDFVALSGLACPQRNLVDGDARCATVAAASIIAKVTRDRIMLDVDGQFPEYGFARHKGYATAEHLAALDRHGPCPLHRRSFISLWKQGELFPATED